MLKRHLTKILAGLAAVAVPAAFFVFGFTMGRARPAEQTRYALLEEAQDHIEDLALTEPRTQELLRGAVEGMLGGLDDPHALYYTPQDYRVLGDQLLTGQFSGVGVWLNRADELTQVVSVLPDTPAAEAGIEPGDIITAVDGDPVAGLGLEEVSRLIQGEAGTRVRVKVIRGSGAPREFSLDRRKLDLPSTDHRLDGAVGIVHVLSFTGGVGAQVRDAVASLQEQGARGFVLDLRGNPGGSLDEAVQVASVFLDGGTVVSYRERGRADVVYEARPPVGTRLPVVVLVDGGSASASEIVAGAIQDRQRGLIVGTETYRKGSVQRVVGLSDGSAIKLTVASYFTPSGRGIGEHGVLPDVEVADRGRQLAKATEILRGMVAEAPGASAG